MSETIVVEAVTDKFKNKYSAGSVLAGGKWLQVSSKLNLADFRKDTEMTVETETNAKGYKSIVGIATEQETPLVARVEKRVAKRKEVAETTGNGPVKSSYEDNKNRRIQVQGILQGVIQSPATINFGDDVQTIATKVLELTDLLIAGMDERV